MKKVLVAVFFLALASPSGLAAQQSLFSGQWGGPKTNVVVLNDTRDSTPLAVSIGGKKDRQLLLRSGSWQRSFGMGTDATMAVVVYACRSTGQREVAIAPPAWATDVATFGDSALTPEYLAGNPNEKGVKGRVSKIKRAIHPKLGHKELEAELDDWLHEVERSGLKPRGITCQNPVILVRNVDVYQNGWQARTITFIVRGDRGDGYTMELVQ